MAAYSAAWRIFFQSTIKAQQASQSILEPALDANTGALLVNGASLQDLQHIDAPTVVFAIKRLAKLLRLAPANFLEFLSRKGGVRAS